MRSSWTIVPRRLPIFTACSNYSRVWRYRWSRRASSIPCGTSSISFSIQSTQVYKRPRQARNYKVPEHTGLLLRSLHQMALDNHHVLTSWRCAEWKSSSANSSPRSFIWERRLPNATCYIAILD